MTLYTTVSRQFQRLLLRQNTTGLGKCATTTPTKVVVGVAMQSRRMSLAISPPPPLDIIQSTYQVVRRGPESPSTVDTNNGTGSREYLLLPPDKTLKDLEDDKSLAVAALLAHRNMIFGARAFHSLKLQDVCGPLVEAAIEESGINGDQPQAMAALHGLSKWVNLMLQDEDKDFPVPESVNSLLQRLHHHDPEGIEAVRAIVTGIPREGHSVVGQGTYRDGEQAWKAFAAEYVQLGLASEASLYQDHGGRLVSIEHMADTNPVYLKEAGGAMARMFFV